MVRGVAGRAAGQRRRDDAEEAHRLHHGQRAPRVQRRQDAAREDELQAETRLRPHLQRAPHLPLRQHRGQRAGRRHHQTTLE